MTHVGRETNERAEARGEYLEEFEGVVLGCGRIGEPVPAELVLLYRAWRVVEAAGRGAAVAESEVQGMAGGTPGGRLLALAVGATGVRVRRDPPPRPAGEDRGDGRGGVVGRTRRPMSPMKRHSVDLVELAGGGKGYPMGEGDDGGGKCVRMDARCFCHDGRLSPTAKAFARGAVARAEGVAREDCPSSLSSHRRAWCRGWDTGEVVGVNGTADGAGVADG